MRLVVLGATGGTGVRVVDRALAHGHRVRCLLRRPDATPARPGLERVGGDPTRAEDLRRALEGADALVSCLGWRRRADEGVLTAAAVAAVAALGNAATPYVVVSQALLWPSRSPAVALLRALLRRHLADSAAMERIVSASATRWAVVRPPRLTDGPQRGHVAAEGAQPPGASLSRRDLAACLVELAETAPHPRCVVGVGPAPVA